MSLLTSALPNLTAELQDAARPGRDPLERDRTEASRVLDATLRTELRDTDVAETRTRLAGRLAGGLNEAERMLAAEIISPLVIPNSSFSQP